MKVTVLYNQGSRFPISKEQKITNDDTLVAVKNVRGVLENYGHNIQLMRLTPNNFGHINRINSDLVFNLCEWTGKDYQLSVDVIEKLSSRGIPFTGADAPSYKWGCNKVLMKKLFDKFNILSPKWLVINKKFEKKDDDLISNLRFPVILKPAYEHCSIGVSESSVLENRVDIKKKLSLLIKEFQQPILIEEFIDGREFQVTVMQNGEIKVFPPAEVLFKKKLGNRNVYSFESKWLADNDESILAGVLVHKASNPLIDRIEAVAEESFKLMRCKGYARLDMRVRDSEIYLLEINVNPSLDPDPDYTMTASSLAYGWSFDRLVLEIVKAGQESGHQ